MYNDNRYDKRFDSNQQYNTITYFPTDDAYHRQPKKHNGLKALGFVACACAISAVSIAGYISVSDAVEARKNPSYSSNEILPPTADSSALGDTPSLIELASRENAMSIPEIVEKITPSVVGISSAAGTGSGIIMSEDGYIITNAHVVENSDAVSVLLHDDSEHNAIIIGTDKRTDLAVIKINAPSLVPAEFGNSDELVVGETVIAIGNPLGFDFYGSVTGGIISGLERSLTIDDVTLTLIQTDAAINGGNSGGPLVNSYGQVIGINSAKVAGTIAEGMGFAIPMNNAKPIVDDLINNGYVTGRPLIGISGFDIDERTSKYYNMPMGVYVAQLAPSSPASIAGIRVGDVIVGINGEQITTMNGLNEVKNKFSPNDTVTLSVSRNGIVSNFSVILGEEKP